MWDRFFDAAKKILQNEGPMAFYRGFFPIWGRFAPQATAGFFMAVTVSPFDMLRTVLMNQPTDRKIYSGCVQQCSLICRNN